MVQRGNLEAKLLGCCAAARGSIHRPLFVLLTVSSAATVTSVLVSELFALPLIADTLSAGTLKLPYPRQGGKGWGLGGSIACDGRDFFSV